LALFVDRLRAVDRRGSAAFIKKGEGAAMGENPESRSQKSEARSQESETRSQNEGCRRLF
ncbi:MAG: hypothetical protein Q8M07_19330, partial [Prosthecobacter sp.]|nr:hypothetical protein [Prosthecobacter sp.]